MLDDEAGPGEGIVWRVRSADMNYNTETRSLSLEHIINTLQDDIIFDEVTWEDIAPGSSECSAKSAAQFILAQQSLWRLGDFEFNDIAWPYQFNGDSLYSALQTVANSCPDCCWEYDLSRIPFRLHFRKIPEDATCEMRAGRNIKTLKRVIDRSGMYTRFYPIGKDDLRLSGDYISKNENVYGMVAKVETFSGAETESALRSWAWERLKRHCQPKVTVTIGGLELSESTGEPLDKLTMNRKCRVPLPEFSTTITERIIRIRVTDKIRKPEEVTVTLGNELPDLASIVGEVEKEQASGSGGGGRGGMKKAGEDHAWFVDTDTHVGMVAEAIIGHSPDGVDWSRVAEVIVDGDGIHNRVTRAEGYLVTMEAKIDLTEEKLRAEFNNIADSLRSELEMSAESLRVEFENLNNSTRSELLITSESLRAEFENLNNSTRSEILVTSESLRAEFTNEINSTRSELQITSESLRTEFTNEINSTRSELQITSESLRTEFTNEINSTRSEFIMTSESMRVEFENEVESVRSQVEQTDRSWKASVAGVAGADGKVTAASIAVAINDDGSYANIDAEHILIGSDQTAETVINSLVTKVGNLEATSVTTDNLSAKIADLATVSVNALTAAGNISASGAIMGTGLYFGSTGSYTNVGNAIATFGVAQENDGSITIPTTKLNGDQGTPINFNIAATQYFIDGVAANRASDVGSVQTTEETAIQLLSEYNTKYKIQTRYKRYNGTWANGSGYVVLTPPDRFQEGYDTGNAHRGSDVGSVATTSDTAVQELSEYNTKYKIQTRYQKADGTWANGSSYVVLTPVDRYQTGYNAGKPTGATLGSKTATTGIYYNVLVSKGDGGQQAFEVDLSAAYTAARSGYTLGTFTLASVTLQGDAYGDITPVGTKVTPTKYDVTLQGSSVSVDERYSTAYKTSTLGYYPRGSKYSGTLYTNGTTKYTGDLYLGGNYTEVTVVAGSPGTGVNLYKNKGTNTYRKSGSAATYYDVGASTVLYKAGTKITGLRKAGTVNSTTYYTKS